jgi:putative ABC transport system permease protein
VFLAFAEIRRAKVRFALLMGSIGLLVFLILFQQTLQSGLITSFIGAIERQSAPVLVYSLDGRVNLQGSVITPELAEQIEGVDGVAASGRIGQGTFSVEAGDESAPQTVAIIGYDTEGLGSPESLSDGRLPTAEGEAVALASAAGDGFDIGDTVRVLPGDAELEVVGLAEQIGLQASTTMFTTYETFEQVTNATNPDASSVPPAAIGLRPADGVSAEELVTRVNDAVPEADAYTRLDAAAETPGVAEVQQSFNIIFLLYGLVVPLVTGLFFLIITLQKAGALTLLRAIGVPGARLVRSLVTQVVIVLGVGLVVGIALYTPISQRQLGGIPLSFQTGAVIFWSVLLMVLGVLSSLFAARRVLAIEPIEATTGGGVGR